MNDDDLMRALREAAQAEPRAQAASDSLPPAADDHPLLDRLTDLAMAELRGNVRSLPRPAPKPKRPWLAGGVVVATLAVAAAFLLMRAPAPDLPGYQLEVALGAEQVTRGASDAVLVFRPAAPFALTLRPAKAVTPPLAVRLFLGSDELTIVQEATARGVVHVRGTFPAALGDAAKLVAIVGRPDGVARSTPRAQAPDVQALEVEIRAPAP